MSDTRIEKDSLGEVEVPAGAYYGAQTERARRNFPVSGLTLPRRFLAAVALIKGEAAAVNEELGIVPPDAAKAIRQAAAAHVSRCVNLFQGGNRNFHTTHTDKKCILRITRHRRT